MAEEIQESKKPEQRKQMENRKVAALTVIDILKSKRHFFILTLALTLSGTLLGHFLKVQTFQTSATLFLQDNDKPSAAEYLLNQSIYKSSGVSRKNSYVNHLNSDSFFLRVAEKIKFNKEFSNLNLTLPENKSKLSALYWKNYFLGNSAGDLTTEREQKLLVPVENIATFLRNTVGYDADYNSQFIVIKVRTLDALTSQIIANLIAEEFVEITNSHNLEDVKEIEEFVKTKREESEKRVKEIDKELVAFKQKHKIITSDATTNSFAHRLAKLDTQIQDAELQQKEDSKILDILKSAREQTLQKIFKDGSRSEGFATDETSYILQSRIDQLKKEKSAYLAQGIGEENWRVQKINKQIDENVARLRQTVNETNSKFSNMTPQQAQEKIAEIEDSLRTSTARISTLKAAKASLQSQIDILPNLQQEYIKLENKFKTEIATLSNIERKEKELEIQRISYKKGVRVDQLAELPEATPRGSLIKKLVFSSLAAFFLGLLIILGLETLDPTVKSRQDLYDCGLDFFGEIPFVEVTEKPRKRSGRFQFGSPEDLVCKNKPESIESMSFKYIRARIESMRYKEKKDCQIITFSSALHNEGKSFVASNLSLSLAQLNRKVLLIDADLRRPSQSAYFNISTQNGLVDLLSLKKDLDDVLVTDQYANLHILPAGFSGNDSTELISSQKFRLLIEHLRKEYDYIVVDTPPTFAAVDAAVVSSFSDIPVLVSSFRNTRKADLYEAYNDLLQVSYKNVFGVINKAIVSNSRIHYYGYPIYDKNLNEVAHFNPSQEDDAEEFLKKLQKKSS